MGMMQEISCGVKAGRKEMVIGICNEVVWYCPVERACDEYIYIHIYIVCEEMLGLYSKA